MVRSKLNLAYIVAGCICVLCFGGCCTQNFPICNKLSKSKPSVLPGIGKTLFDVCNERNIKITVLSSTVAQFSGSSHDMKWLQKNYHFLLCDFDQVSIINDEATFNTCMANAKLWIKAIQGLHPEDLMANPTRYGPICVE